MTSKIPATVVTGFLGAGKTTLIRHLLANADGRRIALIVNEFGDVGVDGDLLGETAKACGLAECEGEGDEGEGDVIELANGCLCCTVAEDFIPTLTRLIERESPPDHIVIETSGLALPQPLVRAFGWPEIRNRVVVDGVAAVVDAAALAEGRFAADETAVERARAADDALDHETPLADLFEDQLACADLLVLNKTDLIDNSASAGLEAALRGRARPGVAVLKTAKGVVDPAALLGLGLDAASDMSGRAEVHHRHDHHHGDEASHHHDHGHDHHHHHDHGHDAFHSIVVEAGECSDVAGLADRLSEEIRRLGLLRVKGFIAVAGKPMRMVLQAAGPRVESYFDRPWAQDESRSSRLVAIGEAKLDWKRVETALAQAV